MTKPTETQTQPGVYLSGEYIDSKRSAKGAFMVISISGMMIVALVVIAVVWIFADKLAMVMMITAGGLAASAVLLAGGMSVITVRRHHIVTTKTRNEYDLALTKIRAEARKAEAEARQEEAKATHMEMRVMLIDIPHTHALVNIQTGEVFMAPTRAEAQEQQILLGPGQEYEVDTLKACTQRDTIVAIIGAARTGKSYQAMAIIEHLRQQPDVLPPIVIGGKAEPGEWKGCTLYIGDDKTIDRGLKTVWEEAERRFAARMRNERLAYQPIILDDWGNTVVSAKYGKRFIYKAATMFATANFMVYFINHSDTAAAWGLGLQGAAIKDAFVRLMIDPYMDRDGQIIPQLSKARIIFPTAPDSPRPARMLMPPAYLDEPVDFLEEIKADLSDPVDEADQQFAELVKGGMSRNKASQQAYGRGYGGDLVARGKKALGEL